MIDADFDVLDDRVLYLELEVEKLIERLDKLDKETYKVKKVKFD